MTKFKEFNLSELFVIEKTKSFNKNMLLPVIDGKEIFDYVTRTSDNRGILAETSFVNRENINESGTFSLGLLQMDCFYRSKRWYAGQFVRKITPKFNMTRELSEYFETIFFKLKPLFLSVLVRNVDDIFNKTKVSLPVNDIGHLDFDYMENYIRRIEAQYVKNIDSYLNLTGYPDNLDKKSGGY